MVLSQTVKLMRSLSETLDMSEISFLHREIAHSSSTAQSGSTYRKAFYLRPKTETKFNFTFRPDRGSFFKIKQ